MYYVMKNGNWYLPEPKKWPTFSHLLSFSNVHYGLSEYQKRLKLSNITAIRRKEILIREILSQYLSHLNYIKSTANIDFLRNEHNWRLESSEKNPLLSQSVQLMTSDNLSYLKFLKVKNLVQTISVNKSIIAYCLRCKHVIPPKLQFLKVKNGRYGICPLCLVELGKIAQENIDNYKDKDFIDTMTINRLVENI